MADFIADSKGNMQPATRLVPLSKGGALVPAGLNEYHTDRIFTAEPVTDIPETNMNSSTTNATQGTPAGEQPNGDAKPAETKAAAAPEGNGGGGGRNRGGNAGSTPLPNLSPSTPNPLPKGGFGSFGKVIAAICCALALMVAIGYCISWMVREDVPQKVADAVNTVTNATNPTPSGTVVIRQPMLNGPPVESFHRLRLSGEFGTHESDTQDAKLASQYSTDAKEIAINHAKLSQSRQAVQLYSDLAVTKLDIDSYERRQRELEAKVAAQQAQLDRKAKTQTVLIVQPVEPVYQTRYRPALPVGYRSY